MKVIKRDGRVEEYNKKKIKDAIAKANLDTEEKYRIPTEELLEEIVDDIEEDLTSGLYGGASHPINKDWAIEIEEIQDTVELCLQKRGYFILAKNYIKYRYKRELVRESKKYLMDEVAEKIGATNIQNQNANVDEGSFGGRMGEANSAVMKDYALNNCMSEMAKNNHLNNEIYIHDLDSYAVGMHNCLSVPFDKLLANGFNTRQTDVRPANSINTAFQLVAVIFQIQSLQQFGGVSATHLDWTMVPYVRKSFTKHLRDGMKYFEDKSDYKLKRFNAWLEKDMHKDGTVHFDDVDFQKLHPQSWEYAMDMTLKEINQAVEGMYHNLNTLQSRSGNQLPFTSINYGTCTLPEGRMVTKALLEASIDGLGKLHKTSIFPCGIFQCMKGVNREKGDPNYDLYQLALRSTSQRLYPNYANVDWTGNAGYDKNDPRTYFSTMGCRTANGWDINGFGQLKDGRGNICPVTIILPTLAMEAKEKTEKEGNYVFISNGISGCDNDYYYEENIKNFMELLDKKIHEAKDMLLERFEWICSQSMESAKFMYENGTMEGYVPEEGIRSALKHGTLAVG